MYLVSIILAAVVVLACQGIQAQECPGVPTTTARFRRPISPKCVYGGFFYRPLCTSDPRYSSRRMRLNVQVVFADNCVPVPSGHLITVLQANSWGEETNDCCQTYVTNGQGRITVNTIIPGHYRDVAWPEQKRPRVIEFINYADKHYNCTPEHFTQLYFRKDRRRLTDPCPLSDCHSDDESLFFKTKIVREGGVRIRVANVVIRLPRTCQNLVRNRCPYNVARHINPASKVCSPADAPIEPTIWDIAGPFYKLPPINQTTVCHRWPNFDTTPKLRLELYLQDVYCNRIPNTIIEVWQVNPGRIYSDDCRTGRLYTNSSGQITITTLAPVIYDATRPAHFHLWVYPDDRNCYDPMMTQLYFGDCYDNNKLVLSCHDEVTATGTTKVCEFRLTLLAHPNRPGCALKKSEGQP